MTKLRRFRRVAIAAVLAGGSAVLAARGTSQQPQDQPTFRTDVDVIRIDVSVLDKDRRPVRGLAANDFVVLENGKPQRLVTVTAVDAADRDPARSARMRYVSSDVAMNDLADALGGGRLFAIVFDDRYLPDDDTSIAVRTREAARHAIEQMGPSDIAAVVYSQESGKTQDFTSDREKLLAAIDRFDPKAPGWIPPTPRSNPPPEADMQRFSTVLMRSQCAREEPSIPTLDAVVSRMASVPRRRKSLLYFSIGVPLTFGGRGCSLTLGDMLKDVFRKAQAANVNIHAIDPAGYNGYLDYLRTHPLQRSREIGVPDRRRVPGNAQLPAYMRLLHDFLDNLADSTGGRSVVNTDAIEPAIERIFEEDGSFYLLGYQTSNGNPDGKFREVEVKVNRPGVTVLTRAGYWAPTKDAVVNTRENLAASTRDLAMAGIDAAVGLPVRANVVAIGTPQGPGQPVDVAVVLSIKLPPLRTATDETLTLTRHVYDADGRAGPPQQETVKLSLQPGGGDELRYDVLRRVSLAPGRYQVRYSARSAVVDRTGTVYADVEVPDFSRVALSVSHLVLGVPAEAGEVREDPLVALLPLRPTTNRDFLPSDRVAAFARVFQGGTAAPTPVAVSVEISDARDAVVFTQSFDLDTAAFGDSRAAPLQLDLPLDRLSHGPFLLSLTARAAGRTVRRDLLFKMR